MQKLKKDYPNSRAVIYGHREPSFADMEKAIANLGDFITVRLDGKGDFKSIQDAINSAPPNSLIEIRDNGPYNETISVTTKGLTLRGNEAFWPVVTSSPLWM